VSWVATTLAAVLAIGVPTTAHVGGDHRERHDRRAVSFRDAFTDRGPIVTSHPMPFVPSASSGEPRRRTAERVPAQLLVRIPASMAVRARPHADAAVIGTMPSGSKYFGISVIAWVEATAGNGNWGRVEIPYVWPRRDGWIRLRGLARTTTHVEVHVDLSRHWVGVTKFGRMLFGLRAATGAPVSPTPPGEYFVTDRIPFSVESSLGSFAFGISGIQPHLPSGWSGGNQLAIHGTNDPSSIGTSASAGCIRVSERGLHRLMPILRLGTPIVIER
jgi:hypothetical protein